MQLFLILLCTVIYVETESVVPAIYVSPVITYRSNKRDVNNHKTVTKETGSVKYIKGASNVESNSNTEPVFYVTPSTNVKKRETRVVPKRKNRQSVPPSTSYGVPLLTQGLPSIKLSSSFSSSSEEKAQQYQQYQAPKKSRKIPKQQYLPPSTSYGVPLLSQSKTSTSFETKKNKEEAYQQYLSPPKTEDENPPQQYLPPSTSYQVPLLSESQSSTSVESEPANEDTQTNPPEQEEPIGYNYPRPAEDINEDITINKNIYFYKAPKDFEVVPTFKPIKLPKPQKNYKVIFIKAPSLPAPAPIVQVAPQTEDKTLVYVLVKKPEEQPELIIPTPAPTQPSKPEVYFIKYETQKEHVESAKKNYGVPQYGKGYYYGAGISGNGSGDKNVESGDDEDDGTTPDSTNEGSTKSKREDKRSNNGKNENNDKNRSSFRSVRSSSFSDISVRNDLLEPVSYFSSLQQRRFAYE